MKFLNYSNTLRSVFLVALFAASCHAPSSEIPVIGFVDAFEDSTISLAREGFLEALKANGYSEEANTVKVLYRNAQGDIPTLIQIVNYMVAQKVNVLATCPSLSTITAAQQNKEIPIFMMVSPTPEKMKLLDKAGNAPPNLFGVSETLAYIDTSFSIIPKFLPGKAKLKVGLLYNQSEPQSVNAFQRLNDLADTLGIELVSRSVSATADVQLTTGALLNEGIDAFFANPDNTIFASFETIAKLCNEANVPIFTSEAGLVKRGAVAAFGADLKEWGRQAGDQVVQYLKTGSLENLHWEIVKQRKRVFNPTASKRFGLEVPDGYEPF